MYKDLTDDELLELEFRLYRGMFSFTMTYAQGHDELYEDLSDNWMEAHESLYDRGIQSRTITTL